MPATTTLATLIETVVDESPFGQVWTGIDPDNVAGSTVTLADSYGVAPVTAAEIPINSPVIFTSPSDGGTATASSVTTVTDSSKAWTVDEWIGFVISMGGWRATITDSDATSVTFATLDAAPTTGKYTIEYGSAFVSNYVPSTGVVTLKPTLGTLNAAMVKPFTMAILSPELRHPRFLRQAVNRALQDRVSRSAMRPLTFVPDGDLQGTTVTDFWTAAANGTAAYATAQIYPAGSAADTFGQVGVNRLVQLTTSGGASTLTGNGMRTQLSAQQRTWYFLTAIRLVSGTGTAELKMRDNTNSADITLQVTRGNDSSTLTTATLGDFLLCEGTFQQPATCVEVAPQLTLSATGLVAQMAPIIMFPLGAYSFPLPNRIETDEQVGNFFASRTQRNPGGLMDVAFSDPFTTGGIEHRIRNFGDHRTVAFNVGITRPLWYEEYVNGDALTALTDTVTFPSAQVRKWARYEVLNWLMEQEIGKKRAAENGTPLPSNWRALRNAALKSAKNSSYEPSLNTIYGRR